MKEDTIQHLASEMDELQEQHREVLAKVRPFSEIRHLSVFFQMRLFNFVVVVIFGK